MTPLTLYSAQDQSVNFVMESGAEARYVRRQEDYFIVYLSSHSGCNQACRMCHLTQTGQTNMRPQSLEEILIQASHVLDYYSRLDPLLRTASVVNFNFMARGEPLLSPVIQNQWNELTRMLHALARKVEVQQIRVNVSTTIPHNGVIPKAVGSAPSPHIYYSMYSSDANFRRRWLPNAQPAAEALGSLAYWQKDTGGSVVLHWALIEGQNDSVAEAENIGRMVERLRLRARFNLVRYNPHSVVQGHEPPIETLQAYFDTISRYMVVPGSRIVPRVGFDVKASCGMFVELPQGRDPKALHVREPLSSPPKVTVHANKYGRSNQNSHDPGQPN